MNEVYFVEITAQEQGIELYDMMKEAMYIEKEREILESQIDKMSEVANTSLDVDLNHFGFWFAFIAFIISVFGPFIDQWEIMKNWFGESNLSVSFPILVVLLFIVMVVCIVIAFSSKKYKK